ncbi:MAG TPA: CDP-alcohol phosphatidyltransferase family protein [Phycisphaerae bacterium]|nr:CDP-alcohol phosphatidyltransferase family protein [Phycisphaerae bacterium]
MDQPAVKEAAGDFRRFKESGQRAGTSLAIGRGFCNTRDAIARRLIAAHISPNTLTIFGLLATCVAAACFFRGGSYSHAALRQAGLPPYMLLAGVFLVLASAMDMLDGAVAKLGKQQTPLGAVLDSSVDRISDAAIYIGLIGHFILVGNLTYGVLSGVAMANAMLISYVKARSECIIPDCSVGYWMRGERSAALLIAAFAGTVPAVLWQQAISPAFTVLRRLVFFHQALAAKEAGRPGPSTAAPHGLLSLLRPWRYPRGSIPYDIVTGTNIAFIIFAHYFHPVFGPGVDPLRQILGLP